MSIARQSLLLAVTVAPLLAARPAAAQPQPQTGAPPPADVAPPQTEIEVPPPDEPVVEPTPTPEPEPPVVAPEPEPEPQPEAEPDATAAALTAIQAFQWSGYIQAQYENHQDSENEVDGSTALNRDRFLIRRGRLKLQYLGIEHAKFTLELDWSSTGVGLKEGTAALIEPWTGWNLELAAGLFKTPFGYETLVSHSHLLWPEASPMGNTLYPGERDVGLRLSGRHDIFGFQIALLNGNPLGDKVFPGRDPNSYKDLVGRLGLSLPVLDVGVSGHIGTEFVPGHPGVAASTTWLDDNGDSIVDASEVVTTAAVDPVASENATRYRVGFDAQVHHEIAGFGKFEAFAEVAYAHRDATELLAEQRLVGGYLGVAQHWQDRVGLAFRVAMLDPDVRSSAKNDRTTVLSPALLFYPLAAIRLSATYDVVLEEGDSVDNNVFTARMQLKF